MIESLEARFKEQQRIKNGQLVDSSPNTKVYARLRRRLTEFTKEKYGKAFSTFFFPDINEQFLLDFAFLSVKQVESSAQSKEDYFLC